MEAIQSFLNATKLARKQSFKNLTIFPVLAPDGDKPDYLTLEQSLERGLRLLKDREAIDFKT